MIDTKPKVSISCMTYNHAEYIRDALEGFIRQKTDFPIEVLIHDDASTDGTAEIVKEYEEKYPEIIKPIFESENQWSKGIRGSAVFNFPRVRGEYIALCEGDDYWTDPGKLQKQVDYLEKHSDAAICFHNMKIIHEEEPHLNRLSNINQQQITTIKDLARGNYIYTASCVFRNYAYEFPGWFYKCPVGDYPLHLLNARYGNIKFMDEVMGVYRVHRGGVWENKSLSYRIEKWVQLLDLMKNEFDEDTNKILRNQLHDSYFQLAEYHLDNEDFEKYELHLMKIIRDNPDYLIGAIKRLNQEKEKTIKNLHNSYAYKLGNIILKPLRIIKKNVVRRNI